MCKRWNEKRERLEKILEINVANLINHTGSSGFTLSILNGTSTITVKQDIIPRNCKNCALSELVGENLLCEEDGYTQDPDATPDCFTTNNKTEG